MIFSIKVIFLGLEVTITLQRSKMSFLPSYLYMSYWNQHKLFTFDIFVKKLEKMKNYLH